ncbi:hypothetical protein NE664_08925 [Anaerotignum faecicola]|nr:hypothetical protein [Anaerotignum faecicola]
MNLTLAGLQGTGRIIMLSKDEECYDGPGGFIRGLIGRLKRLKL